MRHSIPLDNRSSPTPLTSAINHDVDNPAAVNVAAQGVDRARKSARTRDRSKEVPTPKRVARGVVKCRARVKPGSVNNDLDSVVAGGGSRSNGGVAGVYHRGGVRLTLSLTRVVAWVGSRVTGFVVLG